MDLEDFSDQLYVKIGMHACLHFSLHLYPRLRLHECLCLMFVPQSCMLVPANLRATPCVLTQLLVQLDVLCIVAGKACWGAVSSRLR